MSDSATIDESELRARTRALLEEVHREKTDAVTFRRAQYDHGLALVHFAEGFGGLGLSPRMNLIVRDEILAHSKIYHENPPVSIIGIGMGMPVVATYATDEQKKRWLPKILSCISQNLPWVCAARLAA